MADADPRDSRTDEELMVVYQRGDREAFDVLYARYAKPIYNFFRRAAPWRDAADDLLQKTPEGTHRSPALSTSGAVSPLDLHDCTKRPAGRCTSAAAQRVSVDADAFDERQSSKDGSEHARNDSAEIGLMVTEAISALPLTQREVIVLNRYRGFMLTRQSRSPGSSLRRERHTGVASWKRLWVFGLFMRPGKPRVHPRGLPSTGCLAVVELLSSS